MGDAVVGIIGMGDMGKMYARRISDAGWRVHACDLPEKYDALTKEFADRKNVTILQNGHLVSRSSDWIMYSVEAKSIDAVVARFGPSTKQGAIVGGQTSTKAPEIEAFEKHLPADVEVVSCHSLHGPGVDPKGQPLVIINHNASQKSVELVERILSCFQSKHVHLSAEMHDRITADTQAVTHAAFLSMGSAWEANKQFPWEVPRYIGGIENVKMNITLRIYSNKWHVYAGLAILNPSAKRQIGQYAESVTELFKLMLGGHRRELTERVHAARAAVFGTRKSEDELLLQDELLDQFSLGEKPAEKVRNNHLSLLAMVDCWWKLGIVPYDHMLCSTPLFRLWLGIAEYLYRNEDLLNESIDNAITDSTHVADDLEFTFAARDWSNRVSLGNLEGYREKFEKIQSYFSPRFAEATKVGNEMIKTIEENLKARKDEQVAANNSVSIFGQPPVYTTVPALPPPTPSQLQLKVITTGLHNVVRSRASGKHYSSPPLPQIPGIDGTGIAGDGTRYYFDAFRSGGSFASHINVERSAAVPMPEKLDAIQAAALVNPATSSWMAMKTRTTNLPQDFTVLILGATSASGRLAIPLSPALGAGHVIGAARNASALSALGLDSSLVVAEIASETDFSSLAGTEIDLILDYINGPLPTALLSSHEQSKPLQYVHIGTLSGQDMALPGAALRSNDLTIRGSGPGAWSFAEAAKETPAMLEALAGVGEQKVRVVRLEDVESEWGRKVEGEGRVVFVP